MGTERKNRMLTGGIGLERPDTAGNGFVAREAAQVVRGERGGIPVFWADVDGPFQAGLVFRVGRADERATHSGITHLVEHLALPNEGAPDVDFNGFVSGSLTSFWARGEQAEVLALLETAAATLEDLPDRIEVERRILLTEEERRGYGIVASAAAARFGPRGDGLAGYPEFGLRWLGLEHAAAWAAERFNRSNVTLWMTGEPPDELELRLPSGSRFTAPDPRPVPDLAFPVVYPFGSPGGAALSLLAPRTTEASLVASIAVERARHRIRYREGLSYMVDMSWEPLTADLAHVVFLCDCQEGHERATASLLRDVLEDLAERGPTPEELDREIRGRRRRYTDPAGTPHMLFYQASDHVLGKPPTTSADLLVEAESATSARLRETLEEAMRTALLLTRDERPRAEGVWSLYPAYSASALSGRVFTPERPFSQRLRRPKVRLQASQDGLTFVSEQGDYVTVPFSECAVAERWPSGTIALIGSDSSRLVVRPSAWSGGRKLVELIEDHVPLDLVVSMNPAVEQRVGELARAAEHLRADIEAVADHLEFGEVPVEALRASHGDCEGTLLLTGHRLVFAAWGEPRLGLALHDIESIRPGEHRWSGKSTLTVQAGEETYRFEGMWPDASAALVTALKHEAGHLVDERPQ